MTLEINLFISPNLVSADSPSVLANNNPVPAFIAGPTANAIGPATSAGTDGGSAGTVGGLRGRQLFSAEPRILNCVDFVNFCNFTY
ncbi:hypothetical protein FACS1894104_5570 [Actinomycetota bacterium]|nr:hypothetical protein FACS1894104_5570 [Actinomycetota bacterium]